ncbi:MAG TPA: hypothetical protein VG755_17325 [Nannocystaceae bacterium]|nr:hypothetical protein [Nannocystaceae bacterium]
MIATRRVVVALALLPSCSRRETSNPAPASASVDAAPADDAKVEAKLEPEAKVEAKVEPETKAEAKVEPDTTPAPTGGSIDDARGLSREAVVARWGEPDRKDGARWTYVFPRPPSCTDREIVYVLRMKGDEVASVERSTRRTGKVCEGDFGR